MIEGKAVEFIVGFEDDKPIVKSVTKMSFARQTKALELFAKVADAAFRAISPEGVVTEAEDLVTGDNRTKVDFVRLITNFSSGLPNLIRQGSFELNTLLGLIVTSNKEYKRLVLDGERDVDSALSEIGLELSFQDNFDAEMVQKMMVVGMSSLGSEAVVQSVIPLVKATLQNLGLLKNQ